MDDSDILGRIKALVDEEHELRRRLTDGTISEDHEHARIRDLELALDQCWDLLRRRRARRAAGEDPDGAGPRPVDQVEGYRQ